MPSEAALAGFYDYRLIALSVILAMVASYAALDLPGRITSARGPVRSIWLTGGAAAMGLGIWSMHYVGMLAYSLPVVVLYDWPTVLVSLLSAVLASAIALWVVGQKEMGPLRSIVGGVLMGIRRISSRRMRIARSNSAFRFGAGDRPKASSLELFVDE